MRLLLKISGGTFYQIQTDFLCLRFPANIFYFHTISFSATASTNNYFQIFLPHPPPPRQKIMVCPLANNQRVPMANLWINYFRNES